MCLTIFKKEKIISYKEKSFFKLFKKKDMKKSKHLDFSKGVSLLFIVYCFVYQKLYKSNKI